MPNAAPRILASALPLVAALVLAAGMTGCEEDEKADLARLQAKEAAIDQMIQNRACKGGGSCRAIAFGAKPCGGPWKYKVYSAEHVDTLALKKAVAEYNALNRELNERYGWVSDCMFVTEPQVACRDGICEAVAP